MDPHMTGGDLIADVLVRHGVHFSSRSAAGTSRPSSCRRRPGDPGRGHAPRGDGRVRGRRRRAPDRASPASPPSPPAPASRTRSPRSRTRRWRSPRSCCWAARPRRSSRPRRAAGHRPDGARLSAREAGEPGHARARPRAGLDEAFRARAPRRARSRLPRVPGRSALSRGARPRVVRREVHRCGRRTRREGGTGQGLGDRARQWYVGRHLDGSSTAPGPRRWARLRPCPRPSRTRPASGGRPSCSPAPSDRCCSSARRPC